MLALERRHRMIEIIQKEKSVKVLELSKQFEVTEETIRRDLDKLEKQGIVEKTYGGAILVGQGDERKVDREDLPFDHRVRQNTSGKERIGRAIAAMLEEGETIILDSSTTCLEVAKHLALFEKLTVITNGISALAVLSGYEKLNIVSTGGTLRKKSLSLIGPTAKTNINSYYADKAIISCKAVDQIRGIMDSNELEAEIKQAFATVAKQVVLAVDSEKLGKGALHKVLDLENIYAIVTDAPVGQQWEDVLRQKGIQIIIAE
ncbi:MAG: DeoR/GlpR family DNA-binding transcription regulator [Cellulosilyticaceae bacterium]